ncbi:MAG: arylamine N-acetyltransferase [Acutalibacteraceae bacterium]
MLLELCFTHNISIPFENLDILNNRKISWDLG